MLEWLKRHAWKACVPQKGIASSNLALSAKRTKGRAKPVLERDFSFFLQSPPQAGEMSEGRQARRNLGERVCAVALGQLAALNALPGPPGRACENCCDEILTVSKIQKKAARRS